MQRKQYSIEKPVPRQTLWSQKRKEKKKALERKTLEKANIKPPQEDEGSLPPNQTSLVRHAALLSETSPIDVGEPSNKRKNAASLENMVAASTFSGTISASTSNGTSESDIVAHVPLVRPRQESDSDASSESSDKEVGVVYSSWNPSDSDISDGENHLSTSKEGDRKTDEDQRRENVLKMLSQQLDTERIVTPTSGLEEPSPCPPELTYPALVHILRVKHNLTREATEDLMEIINGISVKCFQKKVLPKDARTITKMHARFLTPAQKHYLCRVCGAYVGTQRKGNESYACSLCNSFCSYSSSEYFYYMPLGDVRIYELWLGL